MTRDTMNTPARRHSSLQRLRRAAAVLAIASTTLAMAVTLPAATATPSSSRSSTWAVAAAGQASDSSLAQGFRDPADSYRPKTRWWWTCGDISREEVEQEMRQIAAAGFGGVSELVCYDFSRGRTTSGPTREEDWAHERARGTGTRR